MNIFDVVNDYQYTKVSNDFSLLTKRFEASNANFLITGKAGTGKSTLLKHFVKRSRKNVVVLAPTGLTALNIGGQTIHSFFKFPPSILTPRHIKKVENNKLYKEIDTIVIDEVSMVRADLFDAMDRFMRKNGRDRNKPFGGVQLIMFGDLLQLPPVVSDYDELINTLYESPYFFDSNSFKSIEIKRIELNKVFRQSDIEFISILNAIRKGEVSDDMLYRLNENVEPDYSKVGDDYVVLTTTNKRAYELNSVHMKMIKEPSFVYSAKIDGKIKDSALPCEKRLVLKRGARVMFIRNDYKKRWVNGTLGTVEDLDKEFISVRLDSGEIVDVDKVEWNKIKYTYDEEKDRISQSIVAKVVQYPLKLAWAMTIHKSQGQTFDKVYIDLSNGTFASGQLYVALSRCRSMENLILSRPINKKDIIVDKRLLSFISS